MSASRNRQASQHDQAPGATPPPASGQGSRDNDRSDWLAKVAVTVASAAAAGLARALFDAVLREVHW